MLKDIATQGCSGGALIVRRQPIRCEIRGSDMARALVQGAQCSRKAMQAALAGAFPTCRQPAGCMVQVQGCGPVQCDCCKCQVRPVWAQNEQSVRKCKVKCYDFAAKRRARGPLRPPLRGWRHPAVHGPAMQAGAAANMGETELRQARFRARSGRRRTRRRSGCRSPPGACRWGRWGRTLPARWTTGRTPPRP